MSNQYSFPDVGAERKDYLRRRWREENLTPTRREFHELSRQILDLLASNDASDGDVHRLIGFASLLLQHIRPFYPVIDPSEVTRYETIFARLQSWERS